MSERIQAAYRQLLAQDVAPRTQPLVDWLAGQGVPVESYAGMPSLAGRLPKRVILELATREDVAMIYLIEEQGSDQMNTAAATNHVPNVWQSSAFSKVVTLILGMVAWALYKTTRLTAKRKLLCLLTVLGVIMVVASCGTETPQELPFETIQQVNIPSSLKQWERREPGLLIIARNEEIEAARQFATDDAVSALSQLDFTTHFALLAFRGRQASSHNGFRIESVVRQGHEVALYTQPGRLGGDAVVSSPYCLIRVRKKGTWSSIYAFKLYFSASEPEVASVSHHIP